MNYRYDGQNDHRIHIDSCVKAWRHHSVDDWVHMFAYTLDTNPRNWYTKTELRRGTENWSMLTDGFKLTFEFESKYPKIDDALGMIKTKVFEDGPLPLDNQPDWVVQLENVLECYNFAANEEEEPRNMNKLESEGSHEVQGPKLEIPKIAEKVKTKKINIGIEEEPQLASIGDYWDDETVGHIIDLLLEYQDLFPTKFTKMKGILGDLGIMRIRLKEGVNPVRQSPYRLNPRYKEKVRHDLDKMIIASIIEAME